MTPEVKERIEQIRHGIVPEGYKRTKAGIYPEDWTEYTLGDIYTERKEPGNESLPLLMVSIHSGVSDGEVDGADLPKKVKRIEDKSQYKRAATGDLVFNMMRAWQGAIGTVRTEGMVSPAYIVAEPNGLVDPLFMDYLMRTPRMVGTIHKQSYGVTDFRLRLYWESFAPIHCVLPSVPEQEKIGEAVDIQNKIIDLKEKLLAEKQRQKKYLMQQLLTGKKRLPGFDGEWKSEKLSDFCNFIGGGTPDTKNPEYWNGTIPWISSSDLEIGNIHDVAITRYISEDAIRESATKLCKAGTILLVSRVGVGKIAIAPVDLCTSQDFLNLVQQKHNATFLMYSLCLLMQSKSNQVQGSAIKGIPSKEIKEYTLRFPKMDEQEAIALCLSNADREINLLKHNVEQEKQKKKALMQLLLTGIVRVNK